VGVTEHVKVGRVRVKKANINLVLCWWTALQHLHCFNQNVTIFGLIDRAKSSLVKAASKKNPNRNFEV